MSVLILHLSDIHFSNESGSFNTRTEDIAAATFSLLPRTSTVFIVVSGDIAQSGLESEYEIAKDFLINLKRSIQSERNVPIEFIIVPGNHDCDLSDDQSVRNSVLKDLPNHGSIPPDGLIKHATAVQKSYFDFRNALITPDSIAFNDSLWTIQLFNVEGRSIWFDCLNVAWMSSRMEKQGAIFFPYEKFEPEVSDCDADLRIGVMHHPLNWFKQGNYQRFRIFLQERCDIVISGHEHTGNIGLRSEANGTECIYIEGCVLQESKGGHSGFNLVELRMASSEITCDRYEWDKNTYYNMSPGEWFPWRQLPVRKNIELQITEDYRKKLTDPGATLHHPDKKNLELDDFYVFPDLDIRSRERRRAGRMRLPTSKKNARTLTKYDSLQADVILEGVENAGKTRLLYQLFASYHSQNLLPLFLDARKIKSSNSLDLERLIKASITEQYGKANVESYGRGSIKRKILLIDDFDQMPLQPRFRERLHEFLGKTFSRRILTVSDNFEASELVTADKTNILADYSHFEILPLGYERRGELVRKWNSLSNTEITSTNEWLHACTQAEKLIESARLQHVATTVPILVLSLLQIKTTGIAREMHNSSFAHYFYFLIVGALQSVGVAKDGLHKFIGFATHFSWFVKVNGSDLEISDDQFNEFCRNYSAEWTLVDSAEMLNTFIAARILERQGDTICFTYQYAYYYFLGRYTNSFLGREDVKQYLNYCVENLYVRECSNTLLFLAHHCDNSFVLDAVMASLDKQLEGVKPVTFEKENIKTISELIRNAPALAYRPKTPIEHREEVHRYQDEHDNGNDGLADAPRSSNDPSAFVDTIVSISKTIEIAGVLLSNQFSSLTRETKNSSIKRIFESVLRIIQKFYDLIGSDHDRLFKEVSSKLQKSAANVSPSEADAHARHAVALLLKVFSAAWIEKGGAHLMADDLADNVEEVVSKSTGLAMRLIKVGQQMSGPGRLPQAGIKGLIRVADDNPCVMSVLQLLILRRLYMYETDHDDKHWAISTFDLNGSNVRIELSQRQRNAQGIGRGQSG